MTDNQIDELYGKGSVGKIRAAHYKQANDIAQADEKRMKKNPNPAHRVNDPYADDAIRHHIGKVRKADRLQKKISKLYNEDVPGNSTVGVASIGVGAQGEPGVSVKTQRKIQRRQKTPSTPVIISMLQRKAPNPIVEETFAGAMVFEVSSNVFHAAKMEKRKHKTWRKYLEEDDALAEIREYANKNPGRPIVLRNRNTGEMTFARYGKRGK